jgi:TolB protein
LENFNSVADIYVMNANGTDKQQMTSDGVPKHELSWSPDGTQIAYSQDEPGGGSEIIVADVVVTGSTWTLENPARVTSNGLNNRHAAWSPDGSKIAYTKYETSGGDRDIYVIGADGLNEQQLTGPDAPFQEPGFGDIQVDDNYPSWSPDGTQIAFSRVTQAEPPIVGDGPPGYATEVFIMNADGSSLQRKTVNSMQEYQVSWSNW